MLYYPIWKVMKHSHYYIWKLTIFNKNQHYWRTYLQIFYDLSDIWGYSELIPFANRPPLGINSFQYKNYDTERQYSYNSVPHQQWISRSSYKASIFTSSLKHQKAFTENLKQLRNGFSWNTMEKCSSIDGSHLMDRRHNVWWKHTKGFISPLMNFAL